MDTVLLTIAVIGAVVVAGLLVWVIIAILNSQKDAASQSATISLLAQTLENYKKVQDELKDTLNKSITGGQESVNKSLQSNLETIGNLKKQIGELQGTNKQMLQLGSNVERLERILANPKLRGQMGEWSLENLLANIMPADTFKLQYEFKDGKKVDAAVMMPDYLVPIDAKFPLPGFEAMSVAEDEQTQGKLRREFLRDVQKHIDKIAQLYIRPDEGTLDFAMMFIPAENVYYETIIKKPTDTTDILAYALAKKVIPVSPNVCYAYLMTIVMGLHGLQIEKQAAQIRQKLGLLDTGLTDFVNTWDVLGRHLRNAAAQYQEGQSKLDKFKLELTQIKQTDETE